MADSNIQQKLSFADIFRIVHTNQKTGTLQVQDGARETLIHFRQGQVVGIETPKGGEWLIGEYLVDGEVISEGKLYKAMRLAQRKGLPVEEVLVKRGYITGEVMKRHLELYSRELLVPLMNRQDVVTSFLPSNQIPVNPWFPPVSVPFLFKEAERRAMEWPVLQKAIPSPRVIYDKDPSFLQQVMADGAGGINPLFSDKVDPELGSAERTVYYFVDGRRTVRQLARAGGLDTFSTCKALYVLENKGMVRMIAADGVEYQKEYRLLPVVVRGFIYLLLTALAAALIVGKVGPLGYFSGQKKPDLSQLERALATQNVRQAQRAVSVYLLKQLSCPVGIDSLVEEKLLDDRLAGSFELTCDLAGGYFLRPIKLPDEGGAVGKETK